MSEGAEPALVLTGAAGSAKAALGPTAWAVLEELTLGAERGGDGRLVATTSVRRLAAALGLDKDTVARALARLSSAGYVLRCSTGLPANGSCYVVAPISGLTRRGVGVGVGVGSDPGVPNTAVRPSVGDRVRRPEDGDAARPRRPRPAPDGDGGPVSRAGQLSLLADDASPSGATTVPTPDPQSPTAPAPKDQAPQQPDTEPDDDQHHRFRTSPIRITDSCHPSGGANAPGPGASSGGGAERC